MAEETRTREAAFRIVEALKSVVWEMDITEDELHATASFLNRVGVAGMFPNLLDIAFAVTIIDREQQGVVGTRPNIEGPEYRPGAPEREGGSLLEREPGPDATLLTLRGHVTDAETGEPIAGAELDFWHADEHGEYSHDDFHLRGIVRTAADGTYVVRSIVPEEYDTHTDPNDPLGDLLESLGYDKFRAAHLHLKIRVDGEQRLTTQFFLGGSAHIDSDYIVGVVRDDLVFDAVSAGTQGAHAHREGTFDFALPRPHVTATT